MRFVYGFLSFFIVACLIGYFMKHGAQFSDDALLLAMVIGASAGIASGE